MEFENVIVKPLIENGLPTYYYIYVHDTLVFIKKDKFQHDLNIFNSFVKKLQLTVYTFDNDNINFLDIKILNNGENDSYIKDNSTSLLVQYNSY